MSLIAQYLNYVQDGEQPLAFHRWSMMTTIGAALGNRSYIERGHLYVKPNLYVILVGVPGTRKSTSIKMARMLLTQAGYDKLAADRSTKEKFLMDLAGIESDGTEYLPGAKPSKQKTTAGKLLELSLDDLDYLDHNGMHKGEVFICADEFVDFFGNDPISFCRSLGNMWDKVGEYRDKVKHGKSVAISNPNVTLLGGITHADLTHTFPPELMGQGFFSRVLFVHAEPSGRKVTLPEDMPTELEQLLITELFRLQNLALGRMEIASAPFKLLDKIYKTWKPLPDVRFEHYSNRRFTQLLKICIICCADRGGQKIEECDVIHANTVLSNIERHMAKALGEFGKSQNSDVVHKVMSVLLRADSAVTMKELWMHVHNDLKKMPELADIIQGLIAADKIQSVTAGGRPGFLAKRIVMELPDSDIYDSSFLTREEIEAPI